ncbi:rhodanese-like domain-containing protein [Lacibacter luteus]|uniref:Rhodanese-like domain-containing protein n=1 Tax=Lacibacter luteus TaxID=2508719 RepID=A0A4Q1CJX2_9BACT|nr:rhodanese-like domain-containing protein [Lacibacter luteus]RXK60926.1 rhodanese-like domain-containing protein [Lacibacter luteus]
MLSILKNLFGPATDYKALLSSGALIVDVRTPGEYRGGHIKGSVNIPVDSIRQHITDLKKKGKPVITCCASGMRSSSAASVLKGAGIEAHNGGSWMSLQQKI